MSADETEGAAAALNAPRVVRVAAAVQAVGGVYLVLSSVQLLTSFVFFGEAVLMQYANWALGALGATQAYLALRVYRMELPLVIASAVLAGLLSVAVLVWVAFSLRFTIFSCMQLGAVVLEIAAAGLLPFVIGPARRAGEARRKLEDEGLDLGM